MHVCRQLDGARPARISLAPLEGFMISDSFLFDASSLFFIVWTLTIMALCAATFGRDVLPSNSAPEGTRKSSPPTP
jgi:hypothetical protein